MNIIFIGFKKSGKTTIGEHLSSILNKNFYDIDEMMIEKYEEKNNTKLNIFEIYKTLKEKKFRSFEKEMVESLKNIDNAIISTAGGTILNNENIKILKKIGYFIYLKTSKDVLKKRIKLEKYSIFNDEKYFEKTFDSRSLIYEKYADSTILPGNKTIYEITNEISLWIIVLAIFLK